VRHRTWLALPLLAATCAATTACAGRTESPRVASAAGADAGVETTASSGPTDPMTAMRAWAQCMRDHGMDVPDPDPIEGKLIGLNPPGDKGSAARQAFEEAEEACRPLDTFSEATEPMTSEELAAWRAYAQCMRDRGVRISDPDPAGWPPLPEKADIRSGLAARAMHACLAQLEAAREAGRDR
jgi:hypothetical protein